MNFKLYQGHDIFIISAIKKILIFEICSILVVIIIPLKMPKDANVNFNDWYAFEVCQAWD
jgi:hypothetical protein